MKKLLQQHSRPPGNLRDDFQQPAFQASPPTTTRSNLTQNQLLIWAGQKLHPDVPAYTLPKVINFKGAIDPAHFCAAFLRLIEACDAFRTVFDEIDGVPGQRVLPHVPRATEFIDLSAAADPAAEFQRWLAGRSQRIFALAHCAYDSALFKLGPADFKWYTCQHHLIVDGTSTALFFRHLAQLYERSLAGKQDEPFSLPSFLDYTVQERAYRNSDEGKADAAYWQSRLLKPFEPFSYFRSRARPSTTCTTKYSRELGHERVEKLKELARAAPFFTGHLNVSVFNITATAILAWLHRISGERMVTLGTPQHNRRTDGQRQVIGLLMHALPLRVEVSDDETLGSLAARTAQSSLEGFQHGRILPASPGPRGHFDVVFNYLNTTFPDFAGVPVRFDWLHAGHSLHGLLLNLHDFGATGSFRLDAELNHTLFAPGDERRVFDQLFRVLDAFIENPHRRIREINFTGPDERAILLNQLGGPATPDQSSRLLLHELFEARVAEAPGKTALVHREVSLSYAALNEQAEQLAQRLRAAGAGPGGIVGVCLERSPSLVVALLGVLKSGAAYLPLDASQPDERLAFMLRDAKAALVITQPHLAPRLREATNLFEPQPVFIELGDAAEHRVSSSAPPVPASPAQPGSPAYVIYTSGSTGTPKGVIVPHHAVLNFVHAATAAYGWKAEDRVLQFASIGFDTSVEEIFVTLSAGATLVLRTDDMIDTTRRFLDRCRAWKITVLDLPTAFWHEMTTQMTAEALTLPQCVRQVILGGERALPGILRQWRQLVDDRVRLLNTYGPTEATVVSTVAELTNFSEAGEVPIGRPVRGVRVYVLDQHLQLAPRGVVGELFLGGAGVALGYLGQPELTAHHFIADPFQPGANARLYRTGDLVRWRDDGQLEFVGRRDAQLKLRGHRIEPTEIESTLRRHPSVRQAVVQLREDQPHAPCLVAYVTCDASGQPDLAELRGFVRSSLPEYMVPAAFVHLPAIPLGFNGKVDHHRLPLPNEDESRESFIAPRSATEARLEEIMRQVLRLPRVGMNDNFFDLGGHSLLATRVISQIRSQFGVELSLRDFFGRPTNAALAGTIEDAAGIAGSGLNEPRVPSLREIPRTEPLLLSFAQQRLWFLDRLEPGLATYVLPASVRLRGPIDLPSFQRALDEVIRRHEALRTTFIVRDGQPLQMIHEARSQPLTFEDLSFLDDETRARTLRQRETAEANSPFDLERGPLLRARLLRTATDEHLFLLTTHHIISDGWTIGVLLRELLALHDAFRRNTASSLSEPAWQYPDFAAWQREEMQGDRLRQQLDFWREQLQGASPVLELPTDFSRPAVQRYQGSEEILLLPRELSTRLRALGAAEGTTLFMTLLAAFQALLARLSGQDDFLVGSAIAGRTRAETEGIAGLFVNTLVLRGRTTGHPTVREFLARVRDLCLGAYAHQDMPFEKLVEELNPPRDLSRTPLFQVFFNMLNLDHPPAAAHGLRIDGLRVPTGDSKFDLTLYVRNLAEGDELRLVYNTGLFRAGRMMEFLRQYQCLLEQFAGQPGARLDSLSLATARAMEVLPNPRTRLIPTWEGSIIDQFQRQAAATPEAVAVSGAGLAWNYRELDQKSNQLAHHLRAKGIQRGDIVAVYAQRHPALALAILGIHKAGAAILMLGAANPPALLVKMAQIARPRAWIIMGELEAMPEVLANEVRASSCHVALPVTGIRETVFAQESATKPEIEIGPDDLAAITFTSGTAGEPKAVASTHLPLAHFFSWQRRTFGFQAGERFSVLSGLGHDPLLRNIYAPLLSGGTVCVPDEITVQSPNSLLSWLRDEGITVAHLTPAHAQLLAAATLPTGERTLPQLRLTFFGGDKLRRRDVSALRKLAPTLRCVNFYGTTETPQAMSWHEVEPDPSASHELEVVPIGRGIDAAQLLILNRAGQLAGLGETGEIAVRTPCLARGYLEDEALTRERFLPNPFGAAGAGDRIYRTGDLGRYRLDGSVEIIGRGDRQVKVRGFRIEPAEVEARLCEHPQILRAVVGARPGPDGEAQLFAWYVPRNAPLDSAILRDFLRERLPGPLVPGAIIAVENIPLTANGKINWPALPLGDRATALTQTEDGPRDALEFQLARLWAELLGRESVGVHENFFDLGGHSLLAVKLFARVETMLGRTLPLATLFQAPTVTRLAEVLRHEGWTAPWSSLVAIQPRGHRPPFFCVHGIGGNVIGFRDLARHLGPDQPVFGLQSVGLDGKRNPFTSFAEMAAHYVKEIRQLQPHGPYCLGGLSVGGLIAYEMACQFIKQGQQVAVLALFDTGSRGQLEALSAAEARQRRLTALAERIRYNWKKQFAGGGIVRFWLRKAHTWKRHWKSLRDRRRFIEAVQSGRVLPSGILSVRDANYFASNRYVPQEFPGKLTLFRATEERVGRLKERTLGWQRLARGGVEVVDVPGTHTSIILEPQVQTLAMELRAAMDRALQSDAPT